MTLWWNCTLSIIVLPQKWRELNAIGEELEEHVVKAAHSQGPRWIDHRRRAVSCLAMTNYRSIVAHLQESQDEATPENEKIRAMWQKLTSPKFVFNMALYQDLLSDLAELSLNFQGDQLPLSCVRSRILAAQAYCVSKLRSQVPIFAQTKSSAVMVGLVELSPISTQDLWSSARVTIRFLVTSLTKALLPWLLSWARRPDLGGALVVPNFFHFKNYGNHCALGNLQCSRIFL